MLNLDLLKDAGVHISFDLSLNEAIRAVKGYV